LEAGTPFLLLTGGEILVRSDFYEIAFTARERRFLLWVVTDGTLVDGKAAQIAALHPRGVAIGLYGAHARTHDGVTGEMGSFDAALRAARLLKEHGVPVRSGYTLVPTKRCATDPQQYEASLGAIGTHVAGGTAAAGIPARWAADLLGGAVRGIHLCRAAMCIRAC